MTDYVIKNAKCTNIDIMYDREWLSLSVDLDFGDDSFTSFGHTCINGLNHTNFCADYLIDLMRTFNLCFMKDLIGEVVRVKVCKTTNKKLALGHAIKDSWFEPQKIYERGRNKHVKNGGKLSD